MGCSRHALVGSRSWCRRGALRARARLARSWPIFFDRLAFGLVAGVLVILTGGLEAGIAMHVLNNWLAFGVALAFGDMNSALNPSGGTWWSIPVTLTQSLVYLGLAVYVAPPDGGADQDDAGRFGGPHGPRVRFPVGSPKRMSASSGWSRTPVRQWDMV